MAIRVLHSQAYLHNLKTRLPFRYGIAEINAVPHLFLEMECEVDGVRQRGVAADSLIPKWFTKNPDRSYQDDLEEMLAVIGAARTFAEQAGAQPSVFDWWHSVYQQQRAWASAQGLPALLWNFGVSLVERAVIDAFCRAKKLDFAAALRANYFGLRLGAIYPELMGSSPADWLPAHPADTILVRHTVGLADAIFDTEVSAKNRIGDGLPQTLQANLSEYGLRYIKIKLIGDLPSDLARLRSIADLLGGLGMHQFAFTLDGNEQFDSLEHFRLWWQSAHSDRAVQGLMQRLLYVEQPLHRRIALEDSTQRAMQDWQDRPAMIIDESDGDLTSLRRALECGYSGTSHKNCKGVIKGIANACYLEYRRRQNPDQTLLLSGEDLINIGPVALLQDLAVVASLGIDHVERNGHHYLAGLSMFPEGLQEQMLAQHADLYRPHPGGFPALRINQGRLELESVLQAPFGLSPQIDLACCYTPELEWEYESL